MYIDIFNCQMGSWPIKYLSVPVCGTRLHVVDCVPAENNMYTRLEGWQANTLSIGGRITRIKSCLSSMSVYYFSMYRFPKTNIGGMEKAIRRFFLARI